MLRTKYLEMPLPLPKESGAESLSWKQAGDANKDWGWLWDNNLCTHFIENPASHCPQDPPSTRFGHSIQQRAFSSCLFYFFPEFLSASYFSTMLHPSPSTASPYKFTESSFQFFAKVHFFVARRKKPMTRESASLQRIRQACALSLCRLPTVWGLGGEVEVDEEPVNKWR